MSLNINPSQWNRKTAGNIPYKLLEGFPIGAFGEEEATATEEYIIEADNLLQFVTESFPLPFTFLGTIFAPIRRSLPGLASLITRRISWAPFIPGTLIDPFSSDSGGGADTYNQFIKVTIEYGTSTIPSPF